MQKIDEFDIHELLGRGLHSRVYRASHGGDEYAIKVYDPKSDEETQRAKRRFYREGSLLARLDDPVLPEVWDVGEWEGRPYFVMELLKGDSLDEILEERRLDEREVLRVGLDVAAGLAELHGAGLVHRDVKPANIVWNGTRARLVDFGLARNVGDADPELSSNDSVVGTLLYASPEQLRVLKRPVTVASDLYSLGATLHECCVGKPPITAETLDALLQAHASEASSSLDEHDHDIGAALADCIDSTLAKSPDERPQSARDLRRRLRSIEQIGGPAIEEATERSLTRRDRLYETGREEILAKLEESWRSYRKEKRALRTVVDGPAEAGAYALAKRVQERVATRADLLYATSATSADGRPLEGVRRLLSSAHERLAAAPDAASLEQIADRLGLSPASRRLVDAITGASSSETGPAFVDSTQYYGELARLLGETALEAGETALVVDRVEQMDAAVRAVLTQLHEWGGQYPIWMCFFVDSSAEAGEQFIEHLHDAHQLQSTGTLGLEDRSRSLEVLELDDLDIDEVRTFVHRYFNAEIDAPDLVERLVGITDGKPLELEQTLDWLTEQSVLVPDWGNWRIDEERLARVDFASKTDDLITARLERLTDSTREFCLAASIWGTSIRIAPIADVLDISEQRAQMAAEGAVQRNLLIRPDDVNDDVYEFVDASIRDAFADQLGDRAPRLHARYAEWLEEELDEWTFRLARHYRDATDVDSKRRFEICLRAGERSAEEFAFAEALDFLDAARDAADAADIELPAHLFHHTGVAAAHLEMPDRARASFERAIELAQTDRERARSQLALARFEIARFQLSAGEGPTRRALAALDDPVPESTVALVALVVLRFIGLFYRRHISPPEPVEGEERERRRLRGRGHELLSVVAQSQENLPLTLAEMTGRLHATMPLGSSPARLRALTGEAIASAFGENASAARDALARSRQLADEIGTPRAEAIVEGSSVLIDDILGDPREAARRGERLLERRSDQLDHFLRSFVMMSVFMNYDIRGHSSKVLRWWKEWSALHIPDTNEYPPSSVYDSPWLHARLQGDDATADELREISRESHDPSNSITSAKAHWSGVVMDETIQRGGVEEIEEAIERREALGASPSDIHYSSAYYIYKMYARRYLLEATDDDQHRRRLEEFEDAVGQLEACSDHPVFRAYTLVGKAELAHHTEKYDEAFELLGRAERIAGQHDVPAVLLEVDRLRAAWFAAEGRGGEARRHARRALERAESLGWTPTVDDLRTRYAFSQHSPEDGQTQGSHNEPVTVDSGTTSRSISAKQIELERQLEALLEVSSATSSIVDPEEVSRVVVDETIRVLGAKRGMLFLTEDVPRDDWMETTPRVVRTLDDKSPHHQRPTFSRTVIEKVVDSAAPVLLRSTFDGAELGAESIVDQNLRSVAAAPMWLDEELVGIFYVDNHLAEAVFDEEDVKILQAMANHISVVLDSAHTAQLEVEVAAERKRRDYAERIRAFGADINSLLEIDGILQRLLEEIDDLVAIDSAWAGLLDEKDGELEPRARWVAGTLEQQPAVLPTGEYIATVVETHSSQVVVEVIEDDRRREPAIPEEAERWLGLPIVSGERLIGVVCASAYDPDALELGELENLVALAGQAGVAVEKARLATLDPLTGLYNRRHFFEVADRTLKDVRDSSSDLSALMLDLDDFKEINDTYGHAAGDSVLEAVGERCRRVLRNHDVVGRYGGDEFAVVIPGLETRAAIRKLAEPLREELTQSAVTCADGVEVELSLSIGAAQYRDGDDDVREILERADAAVYAAKDQGRRRIVDYADTADPDAASEEGK